MQGEKNQSKKIDSESIIPFVVFTIVIIVGILSLITLQKLSVNNKYICKYLGGLWMRKESDPAHRCYTYEEYYK